jgi:predicted thioesterase
MADTREHEFTVEGQLLTDVGGTIPVKVLSTPGMIGMMERTAAMLALEQLPDGQATVGFEVCIKHVAGATEGARAWRAPRCARSSTSASSLRRRGARGRPRRSASARTSGAW